MADPSIPACAASTTCQTPTPANTSATGRTRNPLTAQARRSSPSTRVPSCPTGRSANGSICGSRVTSSGSLVAVLSSIMSAPFIE